MNRIPSWAIAIGLLCSVPQSLVAVGSWRPTVEDYHGLLQWEFSSSPIELPAEGLHWQVDTARWRLDSGRIWLQRPTSGGQVTGFVFEGSGRFEMEVPDPIELRQLRRFAENP